MGELLHDECDGDEDHRGAPRREQGARGRNRNGNGIQTSSFKPRRLGAKTGERNLCRDGSAT